MTAWWSGQSHAESGIGDGSLSNLHHMYHRFLSV